MEDNLFFIIYISTNYGIYILDDLYYSKCLKAVGTAKLYWRKPFTRETLRAPVDFGVLDTRRRRENQRKPSKPCCGHNRCTGEIWKPQQKYRNSMYLSILSWLKMIIHDFIYAVIDFSGWVICRVIGVHIYRSYLMMVISHMHYISALLTLNRIGWLEGSSSGWHATS